MACGGVGKVARGLTFTRDPSSREVELGSLVRELGSLVRGLVLTRDPSSHTRDPSSFHYYG